MSKKFLKKLFLFLIVLSPFALYWGSVYRSLDNPFEEMHYSEVNEFKIMNFTSLSQAIHSESNFNPSEDKYQSLSYNVPNILKGSETLWISLYVPKGLIFYYKDKFDKSTSFRIRMEYDFEKKSISKTSSLSVNIGTDQETAYRGEELLEELKKYGKDKEWLEKQEDDVLNKLILETWFKNGSSRYSLHNLGNLKIERDKALE